VIWTLYRTCPDVKLRILTTPEHHVRQTFAAHLDRKIGGGIGDRVICPVVSVACFTVSAVVGGPEGDRGRVDGGRGGGDVLGGCGVGGEGGGAAVSREAEAGAALGLVAGEAISPLR
jgi:hypothetical protein